MLRKLYHKVWSIIDNNSKNNPINKDGVLFQADLLYGEDIKNHTFDVFFPENSHNKMPAIFNIHGGGYVAGSKEYSRSLSKELAKATGSIVFNIEYTRSGKAENKYYPTPIYEFYQAYKYISENSEFSNMIDYDNIFLSGDSSGAHTAALIANLQTNPHLKTEFNLQGGPKVKGTILICPSFGVYKFAGMYPKNEYHDVIFGPKTSRDSISELTHNLDITTEDFPPTIMFSVKGDFVVGTHKKMFLDIAKDLGLSVRHYEVCSGHKLFHSSIVNNAEAYPNCIKKISDFIADSVMGIVSDGVTNQKLYEIITQRQK